MPVERKLTKLQLNHFNCFLLKAIYLLNQRKITFLYRGDSEENLFNRLGVEYLNRNPNYKQLLERLFIIGEKAKHFYSQELTTVTGRRIGIADTTEEVFKFIFDHLNNAIKNKIPQHIMFFRKNISFTQYFNDKKNNPFFISEAMKCPHSDLSFYRNYYLTLLHQLDAINYNKKSHFVSTSENFSVASYFSNKNSRNNVILHCWKPTGKMIKQYKKGKLPLYQGVPYGWQKETSILGGILPHFIIGLEIGEGQLFLNPNLFSNRISNELFIEGFEIDQGEFESVFRQTNYSHWFTQVDDMIF